MCAYLLLTGHYALLQEILLLAITILAVPRWLPKVFTFGEALLCCQHFVGYLVYSWRNYHTLEDPAKLGLVGAVGTSLACLSLIIIGSTVKKISLKGHLLLVTALTFACMTAAAVALSAGQPAIRY